MEGKALEKMTLKELKIEGFGLGMDLKGRIKKADLIEAIRKTLAEDDEVVQAEIDGKDPEIAPEPEPEDPPDPPAKKVKTPSARELKAAEEAKIDPWKGPEWECSSPAAFIKSGILLGIDMIAIGKGVAKRWPEYRGAGGPIASTRVYLRRMIAAGDLLADGKISKKGEGILEGWRKAD